MKWDNKFTPLIDLTQVYSCEIHFITDIVKSLTQVLYPNIAKKYKSYSNFLYVFMGVLPRTTILTEWLRHFNEQTRSRQNETVNHTHEHAHVEVIIYLLVTKVPYENKPSNYI
jgi:hypothetical protein